MTDTVRVIATVNSMREGNSAWRRLADPQTYRPMYGEEAGDGFAGRRLVYAVDAKVPDGSYPESVVAEFGMQDNVFSVELDRLTGLPGRFPRRVPEIEAAGAEPDTKIPEAPVLRYAGLEGLGLDGAGAVHPGGVEVAVLDTGLDDVWASRLGNGSGPKIAAYRQFTDERHTALESGHFHGSHCAGIVASGTKIRLNVGQVLDDSGSGMSSWGIDGLYWAVRQGCRVASMSLGGGGFSPAYQEAVRYARSRGCLVVAAAGNDGVDEEHYPAAYEGAVAVMASSYRDSMRADFSNYGLWCDGTTDGVDFLSWGLDGKLVRASGTSMATPLYARVLALLIAEHGSPAAVLKAAFATSKDTPEPKAEEGFGRIFGRAIHDELRRA